MVLLSGAATAEPSASKRKGAQGDRAGGAANARASRACSEAYLAGRKLERSGHLRDAKEQMLSCAQPSCAGARHGFLRRECLFRFSRLEADIPSVIPVVTDQGGDPLVDVQVMIDGEFLTSHADGLALTVDPGVHVFSAKVGGAVVDTQPVVILQGQQNRQIAIGASSAAKSPATKAPTTVKVAAAAERPTEESPRAKQAAAPSPAADQPEDDADEDSERPARPIPHQGAHLTLGSGALFTIALAGGGGFGLLTYWGRKDNVRLTECTPHCPASSVDHIAKLYRAANISAVVGGVALVTGILVYATSGSGSSSEEESAARRGTAYRFGVTTTQAGALGWLSGSF
jgi:hypothetical protein